MSQADTLGLITCCSCTMCVQNGVQVTVLCWAPRHQRHTFCCTESEPVVLTLLWRDSWRCNLPPH